MNTLLNRADTWLNELGIKTVHRPTCLMVNLASLQSIGTTDEVLGELRLALDTKKLFWRDADGEHVILDSF